jgi:molybdenum cofactor synthesis domain-containing protein
MRTAAVLTISDACARGEREDRSGPATEAVLQQHGYQVVARDVLPDERYQIEQALVGLSEKAELVVTTGGTGISERDITPEATRGVCSKLIEGVSEKMRYEGAKLNPYALLSRGLCGVRGRSIILNLPGSPGGAVESLQAVIDLLPHALDVVAGKAEHEESPGA